MSTVTKQGERDFIKLRPFAKITETLTAHKETADRVPAYDAIRIFADNSPPEAPGASPAGGNVGTDDQFYGANVDGEVSVQVSEFPQEGPDVAWNIGLATP